MSVICGVMEQASARFTATGQQYLSPRNGLIASRNGLEFMLLDEQLADQVSQACDAGKTDDLVATWAWLWLLLGYRLITACGAVAQLGERRVRNAKVRSSILLGSTTLCDILRRYGYYLTL